MIKLFIVFLMTNIIAFIYSPAFACSVCFRGIANDPNMIGLRSAILFMLGILAIIASFLIKFFISIGKRSKLTNPSL